MADHTETLDLPHNPSMLYQDTVWEPIECDVAVVGSGVAGLRTAIEILSHKDCDLVLATKDDFGLGDSWYAQGGVAAAIAGRGDIRAHYQDTLLSGAGLCIPKIVEILVKEAPAEIKTLIEYGCDFDVVAGKLDLGREGAHSQARVIHHADETGEEITKTLMRKAEAFSPRRMEHAFALDLVIEGDQCTGIRFIDEHGKPILLTPKAVVLACGGGGQCYRYTTNYRGAVGDGIGIGFRAGLALRDMAFVQFHPTALKVAVEDAQLPLLTESLRGEGAFIVNDEGERFLVEKTSQGELSTRDVVARGIWEEMVGGGGVFLDTREFDKDAFSERFPTVAQLCADHGLAAHKDLLPITPAAHYMMGGIMTDAYGRTGLTNVFAVGEVANNGVHGANRLASNSLAESLVFGRRTGQGVLRVLQNGKLGSRKHAPPRPKKTSSTKKKGSARTPEKTRAAIQEIMWKDVGVVRTKESLSAAQKTLADLICSLDKQATLSKEYFEITNMATTAALVTHEALVRPESRGAHYRKDIPQRKKKWARHIILKKGID